MCLVITSYHFQIQISVSEHLTYLNLTEKYKLSLFKVQFRNIFSVLTFYPILGYKLVTGGFNDGSMSVRRMTTGALNHFFRENSFRSGFGTTPHRGHFRRRDFSLYKNILLLAKIKKSAKSSFGKRKFPGIYFIFYSILSQA